jgi:hypothetical protein
MMKLFPYVLAGISLGVLALSLSLALVASVVPVTGRIIMSLLWLGEVLQSIQRTISRHRYDLRSFFNDLQRGKRDRLAAA